jgi:Xaa-Pro aminopeptidase
VSERVRYPAPDAELDRRWKAVRLEMERENVDALLVHNHVDQLGGYVKYLSDLSASRGYPVSVVFPRDDAMTVVSHGPQGQVRDLSPETDPVLYGVKRVVNTWSFASASYTARYDAEQLVTALRPYVRGGDIGILGMAQMPHPLIEYVQEQFPGVTLRDAADFVDPIKAVKSDYEKEVLARTIELQKSVFLETLDAIEPGRREWDVMAAATKATLDHDSPGGTLLIGSGQRGDPGYFNMPRTQNRTLRAGDHLTLLIEVTGPEGYFGEVGRTISVGPADDALLEEHEFAVQAWQFAADGLRPGVSSAQAFADYNSFMEDHGRPRERRLHSHGQGYDLVERPLVREDEPMALVPDLLMACHPLYVHNGFAIQLCDNVFITPDGPTGPLHGIEQKVFEV